MSEKEQQQITDESVKRSKFIHELCANPRYSLFNWSIYFSLIISFLFFLFDHFIYNKRNTIMYFLKNSDSTIIEMSIGAIGILISSLAIILVIFDKKQLSEVVSENRETFESFIFPYRWDATLWILNAICSISSDIFISKLMYTHLVALFYYFYIFILVYAITYMLYLISEIIQYVILSLLIYYRMNNSL